MKMRQAFGLSLVLGLLLLPAAASADNHDADKPITWISYVQSHAGKSNELIKHLATEGAKIYDGLMADGHVVTWGVGLPVNHFAGDDWNILEWVTFRDWAAMDAFMGVFMGMQMAKGPEQLMAEQEKWQSLVVPGSHHDELIQHMYVSPSDQRPAYYDLTYLPLKGMQGDALKDLWMKYGVETMNGLQQAGTIGAHGLGTTVVHDGSTPLTAVSWVAVPNLAALGAVDKAFEASDKARGEEATMEMMKTFASMVDIATHHDRIVLVTHFGGGGAGEAGEAGEAGGEGGEGGGE